MCYGTCKHEIQSGPNFGECGGGECPETECTICGSETDSGDSLCSRCKEQLDIL